MLQNDFKLLSEKPRLSADVLSYSDHDLSYVEVLLPTITVEYKPTVYYSYIQKGMYNYHRDAVVAQKAHEEHLQKLETRYQELQDILQNQEEALLNNSQTQALQLQSLKNSLHTMRADFEIMQEYGLQKHEEVVPVYTVTVPVVLQNTLTEDTFQKFHVMNDGSRTYSHIDPYLFRVLIKDILYLLQGHDIYYSSVFGYDTLPEAVSKEVYLQTLLEHYSIHEIFTTHEKYFEKLNGHDEYMKYLKRKDAYQMQGASHSFEEEGDDLFFATLTQRLIMRNTYYRPEILESLSTAPLSWLLNTLDIKEIQHSTQEMLDSVLQDTNTL